MSIVIEIHRGGHIDPPPQVINCPNHPRLDRVKMVIRIGSYSEGNMKRGMTIEYLKFRADLNFEVDFGVNDAIGAIVTKWDLILFG